MKTMIAQSEYWRKRGDIPAPMAEGKKRIVVIHNILWAPYKAPVFSELNSICEEVGWELFVVHVAERGEVQWKLGSIAKEHHQYQYKVLFNGALEDISCWRKVVGLLKTIYKLKPDVAIIPGYSELYNWFALTYCMLRGIPRIVTFDSTEADRIRKPFNEYIKKIYIGEFHYAMTYGTKSREYIHKLGMPFDKIYLRCQASNVAELNRIMKVLPPRKKESGKIRLLYIGRLSPEKNLHRLITAFTAANRKTQSEIKCDLVLVGDGPQRAELERAVADLGVNNIIFEGGVSWSETVKYYCDSDIFILPSLSEPWGVVVNEAMICGLPVLVSTQCGSAHDLVFDGVNGYKFDPKDEKELEDKICLMISRPENLVEMGERSREFISEYSPKNAALQMHRCIQNCIP